MLERQAQRLCVLVKQERNLARQLLRHAENLANVAQTLLLIVEVDGGKSEDQENHNEGQGQEADNFP